VQPTNDDDDDDDDDYNVQVTNSAMGPDTYVSHRQVRCGKDPIYITGCIKSYQRNFTSDFSKKPVGKSGCSMTLENTISAQYPTYFACGCCSNEEK